MKCWPLDTYAPVTPCNQWRLDQLYSGNYLRIYSPSEGPWPLLCARKLASNSFPGESVSPFDTISGSLSAPAVDITSLETRTVFQLRQVDMKRWKRYAIRNDVSQAAQHASTLSALYQVCLLLQFLPPCPLLIPPSCPSLERALALFHPSHFTSVSSCIL